MNKKTNRSSYLQALLGRSACRFILLMTIVMIAFTAFAGGGIFGGKKNRTSNPGGVYAIGVHFCSSLECPDIRIVDGTCDGDYMQKRYGVCICEEGYVADGASCEPCPEGMYSDGINECKGCPNGTYEKNPGDTECTTCPAGSYCKDGVITACPEHAECLPVPASKFKCVDGYYLTSDLKGCECPDGYFVNKSDACQECSTDPYAIACSDSKISKCEAGYYPLDGKECKPCSDLHAAECDSKTGDVIKCESGYYNNAGVCNKCEAGYYCPDGEKIVCPKYAECTTTEFTCKSGYVENSTHDGCKCPDGEYDDPDDEGKCKSCPEEQWCENPSDPDDNYYDSYGGCCELTGPVDVCGKPTRSLEFVGEKDAYKNECYDCNNTKDITGVQKRQCDRCPNRQWYKDTCFAQKCDGFRDKDYGDCYSCTHKEGVKTEKAQCDECDNRVMAGEYCVLKCGENEILDKNLYTCIPCSSDADVHALEGDCEKACPGLRKVVAIGGWDVCVRTCNAHGYEENHKCKCSGQWWGEACDSTCGENHFKDTDEQCHECKDINRFKTTKDECDRCKADRAWDSSTGYCHLKNCVTDTFRGGNALCYACDDMSSVAIDNKDQCHLCTTLLEPSGWLAKREVKGGDKCELTSDYCASKNGFKDYYGNCHSCNDESAIGSVAKECQHCSNRSYYSGGSKCYLNCDNESFMDNDLNCHKCTDSTSYEATPEQCSNCSENRTMVGTYCVFTPCKDGEIFDLSKMECVSCLAEDVLSVSSADCVAKCPNVREVFAGACVLSCSGHGTKKIGTTTCVCDTGWYGERCDDDCSGFRGKDGKCHSCGDATDVESEEDECEKCINRLYDESEGMCKLECDGFEDKDDNCHTCDVEGRYEPKDAGWCDLCSNREIVNISGKNYCALICNGFRDYYGGCHDCDDADKIGSKKAECNKCPDRVYKGDEAKCYPPCGEKEFRGLDEKCYSCDSELEVGSTSIECSKCTGEWARKYEGGNCSPTIEPCTSTQFRDSGGTCRECSNGSVFGSTENECKRCPTRAWGGEAQCYPPCGDDEFRGNTIYCYSCDTDGSPWAKKVECNSCGDKRTYSGGRCYKA